MTSPSLKETWLVLGFACFVILTTSMLIYAMEGSEKTNCLKLQDEASKRSYLFVPNEERKMCETYGIRIVAGTAL